MQTYFKEQCRETMEAAAQALASYCRTDPEMQEWQALDAEDFYDVNAVLEERDRNSKQPGHALCVSGPGRKPCFSACRS